MLLQVSAVPAMQISQGGNGSSIMLLAEMLQMESYKIADVLLEMLISEQREKILTEIAEQTTDYTYDGLRDIFQNEHADRKKLKQDYTPDSLTKLISKILPQTSSLGDICAGTGSLNIAISTANYTYCEEVSERAIPFLLCNLALRNRRADVVNGNSLTGEINTVYSLMPGERFSSIEVNEEMSIVNVENIVMNPPYSMRWEPVESQKYDEFGKMPNIADFPFLIHGLSLLRENGTLIAIMPHGVLFRGNKEAGIRKKMIEKNLLDAVIGLPNKLFANTDIPVCLVILKKNRTKEDILFIDAANSFKKDGKHNVMQNEHITKISDTYLNRKKVDKFSNIVSLNEIQENEFNLNIPRYVDTFEPEPIEDLAELIHELSQIERDIHSTELDIAKMFDDLQGTTLEEDKRLTKEKKLYAKYIREKYKNSQMPRMDSLF